MTPWRRAVLVTTVPLVAGLLAGCASAPARASTPAQRSGGAAAPAVPDPCSLVSVEDVSLYVALASWDQVWGEQAGRSVCRLTASGYTVTTLAMRLPDRAAPPAGLCSPSGSTGLPPARDLLCGYTGPGQDTATAVAAGSGLAVGVRVTGPGAGQRATLLARHALTHL